MHENEEARETDPGPLVLRVDVLDASPCVLKKQRDAGFDLAQEGQQVCM